MLIWFKGLWLAVTSHDVIKVSLQCIQGFSQIAEKSPCVRYLDHYGATATSRLPLGPSLCTPASWSLISGSHVQMKMNRGTSGLFALDLFFYSFVSLLHPVP